MARRLIFGREVAENPGTRSIAGKEQIQHGGVATGETPGRQGGDANQPAGVRPQRSAGGSLVDSRASPLTTSGDRHRKDALIPWVIQDGPKEVGHQGREEVRNETRGSHGKSCGLLPGTGAPRARLHQNSDTKCHVTIVRLVTKRQRPAMAARPIEPQENDPHQAPAGAGGRCSRTREVVRVPGPGRSAQVPDRGGLTLRLGL